MPTYIRLTDYKSSDEKERGFFDPKNRYEAKQEDFEKIPGSPIIYWFSKSVINLFANTLLDNVPIYTGMATSDNDRFLRQWFEIDALSIKFNATSIEDTKNGFKWFPYNKGGSGRKWYGNFDYIVNFYNDGEEIKSEVNRKYPYLKGNTGFYIRYQEHYFKRGITWSAVTSGKFFVRLHSENSIFSNAGFVAIPEKNFFYYMGLLNSSFSLYMISSLAQTLNNNASDIAKLPLVFPDNTNITNKINQLAQQNIDISKEEWDSRETSWDFKINPLIEIKNKLVTPALAGNSQTTSPTKVGVTLEDAYNAYCDYWREKFFQLHANEEELNRLFIDIYELQDELTPDVPLEDITILKNEAKIIDGELVYQKEEIMKQLVSYGVGVMFGRYSLDHKGLWIANLNQDVRLHSQAGAWERERGDGGLSFEIDDDNIIPVLEDDYFADDIASRFVQFVKAAFGEEHLGENIRFIEEGLGKSLRSYFVKGFYEDHIKRYKKRPIYWMVASPKKSFMALMYMHRYEPDVFARVQNNYLREYMTKLEAALTTQQQVVNDESNSAKVRKDAQKQIDAINKKMDEIIKYDRDRLTAFAQGKAEIDLDDGVKVNYCRFKEILYPITGLCK